MKLATETPFTDIDLGWHWTNHDKSYWTLLKGNAVKAEVVNTLTMGFQACVHDVRRISSPDIEYFETLEEARAWAQTLARLNGSG